MQVQKVQNNDYNQHFNGHIVDSSSLRKFLSGLNAKEKALYDSYVNTIESTKDNYNYIFDYISIGNFKKIRKIAALSIQNKDNTIQHPPLLAELPENALNLFKRLAEQYKLKQK